MKKLSICIPVLNEIDNLETLLLSLQAFADSHSSYEFEFVFSDNCSNDGSWEKLKKMSLNDPRIRGIRFSRNIGYQESILMNYFYSSGDALIQYDADMQDPLEVISDFVYEWEKGAQVVMGVRISRDEGKFDQIFRKMGYRFLSWISDDALKSDVGDFRLVDRKLVEKLKALNTKDVYLRGVVSSIGFREAYVPYRRKMRVHGLSKFSKIKVIKLGFRGLAMHSNKILRIFIPIALAISLMAFAGILWVLALFFSGTALPKGFSSSQIILFSVLLLNSLFFAISGEYILRIHSALYPTEKGFIQDNF
jgi:glycosyltransferase involved in cell wall biosynthesis